MVFDMVNWIPYNLVFENDNWLLYWVDAGDYQFHEPFFDETITILRTRFSNRRYKSCTSLDFFLEMPMVSTSITLTAMIFHVSRCGSTLLTQALAKERSNIVVPEAPIFDQILRMDEFDAKIAKPTINNLLQKAIACYGQARNGCYSRLVLKLDSWHIHFYEQLRALFPTVSFYFLIREPGAVLNSHIRRRGVQAIPGYINPKLLKIQLDETHYQNFTLYTEQLLRGFYLKNQSILDQRNPRNFFFDYAFGTKNLLKDFYLNVFDEENVPHDVLLRLKQNSKTPNQAFTGDAPSGYQTKNESLKTSYEKLYAKIEAVKNTGKD